MTSPQYVVREKWRPGHYVFLVCAILAGITAMLGLGYYLGNQHSLNLISENDQLRLSLEASKAKTDQLEQELVMQHQMNRVEQAANAEAGQSIESQFLKIRELERELTFYRSILAPEESAIGLQVSQFQHQKIDSSRYAWQVSLLQAGAKGQMMSGLANIDLIYRQDGNELRMPLLNKTNSNDFGFKFRYFQHLNGEIELSEGMQPVALEVRARLYGPNSSPLTRRFDWQQADEEGEVDVE